MFAWKSGIALRQLLCTRFPSPLSSGPLATNLLPGCLKSMHMLRNRTSASTTKYNPDFVIHVVVKQQRFATDALSKHNLPQSNRVRALINQANAAAKHYMNGTKLLVSETRQSYHLLKKVTRGETLARREYLQLVRSGKDLFKLVPFVIIMVVPFLEFALPVLLKLFPNMLPSTFEDSKRADAMVLKQLKAKLKIAQFIKDSSAGMSGKTQERIQVLLDHMSKPDCPVAKQNLTDACGKLDDKTVLGSLSRRDLILVSRYMGIKHTWLPTFMLNYTLRKLFCKILNDDKMILAEGVDSLSLPELRSACHTRGIYTDGVSEKYMRDELLSWIRLHVLHKIPGPILIISRAFVLSSALSVDQAMQKAVTAASSDRS